ncbi:MAG: hypothetical protein AAF721_01750 [Myxococcota bacterium]
MRVVPCLLLLVAGCFSEPATIPVDSGESDAASGGEATTGSQTGSQSTGEPGGETTASADEAAASTADVTADESTAGGSATTQEAPVDTGAAECGCGWFMGAYECTVSNAGTPGDAPLLCPMGFGPGSDCSQVGVGVEGCCDDMANVLYCNDNQPGVTAEVIDCGLVVCNG